MAGTLRLGHQKAVAASLLDVTYISTVFHPKQNHSPPLCLVPTTPKIITEISPRNGSLKLVLGYRRGSHINSQSEGRGWSPAAP